MAVDFTTEILYARKDIVTSHLFFSTVGLTCGECLLPLLVAMDKSILMLTCSQVVLNFTSRIGQLPIFSDLKSTPGSKIKPFPELLEG
jgi:hypothetical protein